jgi:hypothetical protein
VATRDLGEAEALGWLVNLAFDPGERDLVGRLPPGEPVRVGEGPYAHAPGELDDDLPSARERWRRLSGGDPGDDALVVGTGWGSPRLLVPRSVVVELIDRLAERRRVPA